MLNKANITWSAKQITKMVGNGKITFDNAIQRGLVWTKEKKSLLIDSMIQGYPIPPFFAKKKESGIYDMLDGKQRMNSIADFINNDYELCNLEEITYTDEEEKEKIIDINGKKFEELPEEFQDKIKDFSFTIYYFDEGITDEEVNELFYRLNNGKPLSAIELTRVRAKSFSIISNIGKHKIFADALTESALSKYTNEDIVMKSYAILNDTEPSLDNKHIRNIVENTDFTEADQKQMEEIFDRIYEVHNLIKDKKIQKKIYTRTHLLSILPTVWKSLQDGLSEVQYKEFMEHFFAMTDDGVSISQEYNEAASKAGTGSKQKVKIRLDILEDEYKHFFMMDENTENIEENTDMKTEEREAEESTEIEVVENTEEEININENIIDEETTEEKEEYRYGMRLRGFSIGCQPKEGFIRREDDKSGYYHDVIVYDRKLTEQEISDYELDDINGSWFAVGIENVKESEKPEEEQMEVNDLLDEIAG